MSQIAKEIAKQVAKELSKTQTSQPLKTRPPTSSIRSAPFSGVKEFDTGRPTSLQVSDSIEALVKRGTPKPTTIPELEELVKTGPKARLDQPDTEKPNRGPRSVPIWPWDKPDNKRKDRPPASDIWDLLSTTAGLAIGLGLSDDVKPHFEPGPKPKPPTDKPQAPQTCLELQEELSRQLGFEVDLHCPKPGPTGRVEVVGRR